MIEESSDPHCWTTVSDLLKLMETPLRVLSISSKLLLINHFSSIQNNLFEQPIWFLIIDFRGSSTNYLSMVCRL